MTALQGLSEEQALARRQRGDGNDAGFDTSRSYTDILRRNLFNVINVVIFCIGVLLILLGRTSDALTSIGLILMNVIIGAYQEMRAKRQLDKIALLTRPKVAIIREGQEKAVDPAEVVLGDILVVRPGDQIVVDGAIVDEGRLEVDESLLTGESDLIVKSQGDMLLSGSFCVTGSAVYEAQRVGADSFANRLTASARAFRATKTPLQREIDFAIRLLTLIAVFLGFLMTISAALNSLSFTRSVQAAAVIAGIVPNGLFFTVIIAYALGAVRISRQGALIQQSNAVESLSNVDLLCMDKTGTLTANRINFHDVYPIEASAEMLKGLLGDFARSASVTNRTGEAIAEALEGRARPVVDEVVFSSARKWSALAFDDGTPRGAYVLGALEMLQPYLREGFDLSGQVQKWSDAGLRVLLFAHHADVASLHDAQEQPQLPPDLVPLGLLSFSDELRAEARETLTAFINVGIQPKVISGDSPHTVAALARQAGLPRDLQVVSGPELAAMDEAQFEQTAEEATIFGRITPDQKEKLVDALRQNGHYVAMIGDGVNDVLSLKKANLGIAMQSGSSATRSVADMVLLGDSFAALPLAFSEGQRIVNGMTDILRLFLTRAFYVAMLILAAGYIEVGFPFQPKHITLLTLLTVGIPAFMLAMWARPAISRHSVFRSVLHFVLPAAFSILVFGLLVYALAFVLVSEDVWSFSITPEQIAEFKSSLGSDYDESSLEAQEEIAFETANIVAQSAVTVFTMLAGILLIVFVEPPTPSLAGGDELSPDKRPTALAFVMLAAFVAIVLVEPLREFFELIDFTLLEYAIISVVTLVWALVLRYVWRTRLFERSLRLDDDFHRLE
jgi:cation-transporting ATPase E